MTDKDKAKELASLLVGEDQNPKPLIDVLLDMAKWKETQVKKSAKTQHVDKTCKEKGNSLTQESEAIDFEQELYKAFGQIKDFTLGVAIAKRFYDMGRKHNEPVSEELEKEIQTWADYFKKRSSEFNRFFFEKTARHFAEWQKQKMMKNAIDAVVHIDAGGYPYIPQIELYDYDKDIPLAKEGDKYKVILIKEE